MNKCIGLDNILKNNEQNLENSWYWFYKEKNEAENRIKRECINLPQKEYKNKYDTLGSLYHADKTQRPDSFKMSL